MEYITTFMNWAKSWIYGGADLFSWLGVEINFGFARFTPIMLITITGLLTYVITAIIRWIL